MDSAHLLHCPALHKTFPAEFYWEARELEQLRQYILDDILSLSHFEEQTIVVSNQKGQKFKKANEMSAQEQVLDELMGTCRNGEDTRPEKLHYTSS
ncbi:hypothetical protein TNIN_471431 [Trichonephila inaurata madagascariensis]|uniref:Uncharacterized protein n=1 Tax=Trichonephila inaurata madagascariensis TaxID=2747483 RepID=A0A8X6XD15_9ARAC|nr:hypothetical protein TNIN_471431 [Trichonephila inaurata madagascariensis]